MLVFEIAFLYYRNAYNNEYIRFRFDSLNKLRRYIKLQFFNINLKSLLFRFKI